MFVQFATKLFNTINFRKFNTENNNQLHLYKSTV